MKEKERKFDVGDVLTIETAEKFYRYGIATIITDGRYIQIEKEPTSLPAK